VVLSRWLWGGHLCGHEWCKQSGCLKLCHSVCYSGVMLPSSSSGGRGAYAASCGEGRGANARSFECVDVDLVCWLQAEPLTLQ
jgi:hypothetical protein